MTVPSINEQSAITAFLDCETTKIDELIAEARRVIELLKERCIALISALKSLCYRPYCHTQQNTYNG